MLIYYMLIIGWYGSGRQFVVAVAQGIQMDFERMPGAPKCVSWLISSFDPAMGVGRFGSIEKE